MLQHPEYRSPVLSGRAAAVARNQGEQAMNRSAFAAALVLTNHCSPFSVRTGPCLLDQEGQVMNPVVLTDAAWINHMRQIVFGVCDDEIRVCH
jgi:hypothetical protein